MKLTALSAMCALLGFGARAQMEPAGSPRWTGALEVDVSAAYSLLLSPHPSPGVRLSSRNGGPGAAVSVLLRSGYFLSPFLDVSFHPLYASTDQIDLGPLGGLTARRSSVLALGLVVGGAFDVRWLRLRAGIGSTDLFLRSRSDHLLRTSERDMTYFVSASGFLWSSGRFKVGLESRVGIITEASLSFFTLGIVAGADAARWPGDR